jgi:hypothetical protein
MSKWILLLIWSALLPALAQEPTDIPEGNPTQFPGGDAAWSVDVTPDNHSNGPAIKHVDFTRVGGIVRYVIIWADGKTTERWRFNNLTIDQNPATGGVLMILDSNLLGTVNLVDLSGFGDTAASWVDRPLYKETKIYNKILCYHYTGMIARMHLNLKPPPIYIPYSPTMHEAWIDKKTHLPLMIDDGYNVAVFTFLPTPTAPLKPPTAVAAEMKRWSTLETPLRPSPPPQ